MCVIAVRGLFVCNTIGCHVYIWLTLHKLLTRADTYDISTRIHTHTHLLPHTHTHTHTPTHTHTFQLIGPTRRDNEKVLVHIQRSILTYYYLHSFACIYL